MHTVSSVGHTPFGTEPTTTSPNLHIRAPYASPRPFEYNVIPAGTVRRRVNPPPLSIFPLLARHTVTCVFQDTHRVVIGRTRFSHRLLPDTVNNRVFFPLFYLTRTYTRGQTDNCTLRHFNGRSRNNAERFADRPTSFLSTFLSESFPDHGNRSN